MDMDRDALSLCEQNLGLSFANKSLLKLALTHRSFSRHSGKRDVEDNERLEYLGDAVLKLAMSNYLYQRFSEASEGELTKIRAKLVSDKNLAVLSERLKIGPFIQFSYGEKSTGGMTKVSNLANVFEALLGAIYLDQGFDEAYRFLERILEPVYDQMVSEESLGNYKTQLQELLQSKRAGLPVYELQGVSGPDHHQEFEMKVSFLFSDQPVAFVGRGLSKKAAQQSAAKVALEGLGVKLEI
jgi:ribonuclease-3